MEILHLMHSTVADILTSQSLDVSTERDVFGLHSPARPSASSRSYNISPCRSPPCIEHIPATHYHSNTSTVVNSSIFS